MRKKLTSVLLLSALVLGVSLSGQSEPEPEKEVTICYYGVTMKVSQKIAKRYFKLGATEGPCGGVQGEPGGGGPVGPFPF